MKYIKLVLLLLLLVGCTNYNDEKIDKSNFDSNDASTLYEFTHKIEEQNEVLEYDGEPINFIYSISNSGNEFNIAIGVLMNGMIQKCDFESSNDYMKEIHVNKGETKTIKISFTPSQGMIGDTNNMNVFTLLNPTKKIKSLKSFTNQNSLNQLDIKKIKINKDIMDNESNPLNYLMEDMSQEQVNSYIEQINDKNISKLDTSCDIVFMQNDNIVVDVLNSHDVMKIKAGGPEGEYQVLEFENMNFNNLGSINIQKDKYTCFDVEVNDDLNNYFILLIKKGEDSNGYIYQSNILFVK